MQIVEPKHGFNVPREEGPPTVLHSFAGRMGYPGIGITAYHLVEETAKSGCPLISVSASYDRFPRFVSRRIATLSILGRRIPFKILGQLRARKIHDRLVANLLHRYGKKIDIVHCWPGSALRTLKMARQHKIVSFLHRTNTHTGYAYEIVRKEHEKLGVSLPRDYFFSHNRNRLEIEEAEYRLADKIVVPSEFAGQTFLDHGFAPEKISVIQYGYDPDRFSLPPDHTPARPWPEFTVAFVGRGEPRKGLHYALRAWIDSGLCERGKFLIAGNMHFLPEYRRKIEHWLAHPSISELGEVSDVGAVLRDSDVLVLPTMEEGSAKVTYEARACGCVLAVSNHSGAQCRHMVDGLIHSAGDRQTLQLHLWMLEKDRALYERLRTASVAGLEELTWAYAAKRLIHEYNMALKHAGSTDSG